MIVIIDTSVWIDFFAGQDTTEAGLLKRYLLDNVTEVALTDLILCEILQGIKNATQEKQIRHKLLALPIFNTGGAELAIKATANYRSLRKKGVTVRGTIDCLLATYAIENDCFFLHRDKDYDAFEKYLGLKVCKL